MLHRHLNHSAYTLAAIDDIIGRGTVRDWVELDAAIRSDAEVLRRVKSICERHKDDVYAQRYQFWRARAD